MGAIFAVRETTRALSATPDDAFILAFRDTYMVAVALAAAAILVSFTLWPRVGGMR